jgi:hypothetical protein
MNNKETLKVGEYLGTELERFCVEPPMDCGRGEVLFDEDVRFSDGHYMAIQVIASETPDEEECWTQGVLFNPDGYELGCTDVGESFLGEYQVDNYVVNVEIKNE